MLLILLAPYMLRNKTKQSALANYLCAHADERVDQPSLDKEQFEESLSISKLFLSKHGNAASHNLLNTIAWTETMHGSNPKSYLTSSNCPQHGEVTLLNEQAGQELRRKVATACSLVAYLPSSSLH